MRFAADEIAACTGGSVQVFPIEAGLEFTSLNWDSRKIEEGDLYVALPGERVDGHAFVEAAFAAGAMGALVSQDATFDQMRAAQDRGGAIVKVDDTFQALPLLAGAWRDRLQGTVLALTGSSGKTTTKNLVRDVLAAHGQVVATAGNQNNELGVPATLLRAEEQTRFVVVEMGMRGLHQLEELCIYAKPDMALVTNVGTSHMELLGSRQNIARAKAEPFASLREGGVAFMNASDEYVQDLRTFGDTRRNGVEEVFFDGSGKDPSSYPVDMRPAVYAEDIVVDGQGCPSFILVTPAGRVQCDLQMRGLHNVHNAAAAAAVGWRLGMSPERIASALADSVPVAGRQHVLCTSSGVTVVDDSYNANPDSMRASLAMFASMDVSGRRFAVLGDMGELGDYTHEGHASMGAYAAQLPIAHLVCVGELSKTMAQAAVGAGMDSACVTHVADAPDALRLLKGWLQSGDAVLVKASHSMALERIVEGLAD